MCDAVHGLHAHPAVHEWAIVRAEWAIVRGLCAGCRDLHATLHAIPPLKHNIDSIDDARLFYRLSCKGPPCLSLPRNDEEAWLQQHVYAGYTSPDSVISSAA